MTFIFFESPVTVYSDYAWGVTPSGNVFVNTDAYSFGVRTSYGRIIAESGLGR